MTFEFWDNDIGIELRVTLTDSDRAAVDLTGGTATLRVPGQTARTCTVMNQVTNLGTVSYTTIALDFTPGEYSGQIRVALPDGSTRHSDVFTLAVSKAT